MKLSRIWAPEEKDAVVNRPLKKFFKENMTKLNCTSTPSTQQSYDIKMFDYSPSPLFNSHYFFSLEKVVVLFSPFDSKSSSKINKFNINNINYTRREPVSYYEKVIHLQFVYEHVN